MKNNEKTVLAELIADYERWAEIFEKGGHDPWYEDGYSLNMVRKHIISDKIQLAQQSEEALPEEYDYPLPPELPDSFMVRNREIWYGALKSYQSYINDEDYKYLCQIRDKLPIEANKKCSIDIVTGYKETLKNALEKKEFLTLRRHEKPERYLKSFADCRAQVENIQLTEPEKKEMEEEQLDLFQIGLGIEGKLR